MSALPLQQFPFSFAPSMLEDLIGRLDAEKRARLIWYPQELRSAVVEPLVELSASARLSESSLDALVLNGFLPAFIRLSTVFRELAEFPSFVEALSGVAKANLGELDPVHKAIKKRLDPLNQLAADYLRQVHEWVKLATLRVLDSASEHDFRAAFSDSVDSAHQEILSDPASVACMRLLVLEIAASEVLCNEERYESLDHIPEWCELASDALGDFLARAPLLQLPTPRIPGFKEQAWEKRLARSVLDGLSDDRIDAFAEATS